MLLGQLLLEAWHFGAAKQDDLLYTVVVNRDAAGHELFLIQTMETWPAQVPRAIRVMAFGAARIVNAASGSLLRRQSKLGVSLAWLGIAAKAGRNDQNKE